MKVSLKFGNDVYTNDNQISTLHFENCEPIEIVHEDFTKILACFLVREKLSFESDLKIEGEDYPSVWEEDIETDKLLVRDFVKAIDRLLSFYSTRREVAEIILSAEKD